MDVVVVVGSIIFLSLLWAWSNRPEAPKPEEHPQETISEGVDVIIYTIVIAIVAIGAVLFL